MDGSFQHDGKEGYNAYPCSAANSFFKHDGKEGYDLDNTYPYPEVDGLFSNTMRKRGMVQLICSPVPE